jgi:hypothetical protein
MRRRQEYECVHLGDWNANWDYINALRTVGLTYADRILNYIKLFLSTSNRYGHKSLYVGDRLDTAWKVTSMARYMYERLMHSHSNISNCTLVYTHAHTRTQTHVYKL